MIESLAVYLLVGSLCFGLGYACGTHATWLPALGSKVKSGVGGLFSRKVVAPAPLDRPSLVGEQGRELLVPGAHWVTINVDPRSGGGGGGSSTVAAASGGGGAAAGSPPELATAPPPLWFMQPPGDSK